MLGLGRARQWPPGYWRTLAWRELLAELYLHREETARMEVDTLTRRDHGNGNGYGVPPTKRERDALPNLD